MRGLKEWECMWGIWGQWRWCIGVVFESSGGGLPGLWNGCCWLAKCLQLTGIIAMKARRRMNYYGWHDVQEEEKKRYSLAVIPPMMLDSHRRSLRYHNENGLILDPQAENKEAMLRVQYWSPAENETFKERYLAHPKNFGYIANALDNKVCMWNTYSTQVSTVWLSRFLSLKSEYIMNDLYVQGFLFSEVSLKQPMKTRASVVSKGYFTYHCSVARQNSFCAWILLFTMASDWLVIFQSHFAIWICLSDYSGCHHFHCWCSWIIYSLTSLVRSCCSLNINKINKAQFYATQYACCAKLNRVQCSHLQLTGK